MSGTGRHALRARPLTPTRLGVTAAVAAVVAAGGIAAAIAAQRPASGETVIVKAPPSASVPAPTGPAAKANAAPAVQGHAPVTKHPAVSLVLTAADRRDCPESATACVDLTRHITWLQAQGQVTFGPVQMEPGQPGGQHQTPRGTFQVAWEAGPTYESTIYHEAMPWATFFAPGGIAFHGGSLTSWSHGCVHLTVANAHYYNEHLPIGAQVVVF
jgi:lipoprotein-anchoring transpeptidase ErfK/SrfK